ncbi:MAG: sulfotransferase family 2 domain-containing protein [Bacteroidota bacterium]
MLVSHRKSFIFTKTAKTAGTSVEAYFEQYCMCEGEYEFSHFREAYESECGVIGHRGSDLNGVKWWNHMSADKIKARLDEDVWDRYFKFTVVRNPYDKLVSRFKMLERWREGYSFEQKAKAVVKKVLQRGHPYDQAWGRDPISRFRGWVKRGGSVRDRDKYFIDGELCVDYFIRYEDLPGGIREVCERIGVEFDPEAIPMLKPGGARKIPVADYYDAETIALVRERFDWEFERFGYEMP